jgi:hypothetical protein
MVAVGSVTVPAVGVVHVIAVGDRFVPAVAAVRMGVVLVGGMRQGVLVVVALMRGVRVPVMDVVRVAFMLCAGVPAPGPVVMGVPGVDVVSGSGHCSSLL